MREVVKSALRIKSTAFDGEVLGLIAACKADLRLAGVLVPEVTRRKNAGEAWAEENPLLARAIILYAKAHFGYVEKSERFGDAYEALKAKLSLAGEHRDV